MAVIIENMKLPDSCGKCYLCCKVGSYTNPVYRCSITGSIIDYTNHVTYKCNDCPLKEVTTNIGPKPTGHEDVYPHPIEGSYMRNTEEIIIDSDIGRVARILQKHMKNIELDKEIMEEFYKSYEFLRSHPMFVKEGKNIEESKSNWKMNRGRSFLNCLDIDVVKVDPTTYRIENEDEKNTLPQVWLESGPKCRNGDIGHDLRLDTGADTFEEAIIDLAKLVKKVYGEYTKFNMDDFTRIHKIFED